MDEKKSNNKSRFKVTMKKRKVNKVTEGEETATDSMSNEGNLRITKLTEIRNIRGVIWNVRGKMPKELYLSLGEMDFEIRLIIDTKNQIKLRILMVRVKMK